jgi:multisubunit Na+/H+ antiporter MnhB subunit
MPEFVASLLAAAAFCLALLALNALTRVVIQTHLAPSDLGESGFLQIGGALLLARVAYRRAPVRRTF